MGNNPNLQQLFHDTLKTDTQDLLMSELAK
ncbi:hypothetical protein SAMN05443549_102382 [Flavobacterium fluvii]|uniref:Uncharacterized protein n=1 Tax=Flavobacterium fluvii TaxID=468056 RepID=A0A1M5HUB9_9FLAO|nr:hypothetical protein SAMN05443549_102382 [Flavobacterium fluvii]